jgi:hypothetical protein
MTQDADDVVKQIAKMEATKAFALLVSKCASGLLRDLVETGKTETEARNAIVRYFLDFASGEACRIARGEGREPDQSKWQAATEAAFARAVKRTALKLSEGTE